MTRMVQNIKTTKKYEVVFIEEDNLWLLKEVVFIDDFTVTDDTLKSEYTYLSGREIEIATKERTTKELVATKCPK